MKSKVNTAVFPVAGRGTRFLPATKAIPKEMLPIVDKPLIQYAVEEAVAAGATRLVFITHRSKGAIERHFQTNYELESILKDSGKEALLELLHETVPPGVRFYYVEQGEPLGLGHAVLCAKEVVGDEPFFVHLPDDLIRSDPGCLSELSEIYEETGASVIAVEPVPQERTSSYGIVDIDERSVLKQIVEKPDPQQAPSNLAVVGRYLLTPDIFDLLERTQRGAGGEIQLTDAIAELLPTQDVTACRFSGIRYDCGNKYGYVTANLDLALEQEDIRAALQEHLKQL
ncbi:UTP--glucose-1-phosphate uridylyltransferase GalU [Gammaproteobacteria bacterium]|nr:UTP--glucose-1-phosphate uridylyltransferase GalU [Gammaproteobacteria bacterium]